MPEGYARLPGAGYEALHPELKDVNPEDYPDIHKMAILADVAPYSREYHTFRQMVGKQAQGNTELEIEYEKILKRVKQTRESVIRMQDRHFTEPVDEIAGTVEDASAGGITLKEYPGRLFQFSTVSTSAADMSARILGENNNTTRFLRHAETKTLRARQTEVHPRLRLVPLDSQSLPIGQASTCSLHALGKGMSSRFGSTYPFRWPFWDENSDCMVTWCRLPGSMTWQPWNTSVVIV